MTLSVKRTASVVIGLSHLAIGVMVALFGVLVSAFNCSNACYESSDRWWDRPGSAQWDTVFNLSLGLFVVVVLFFMGIVYGRAGTWLIAAPALFGQVVIIVWLWILAASTDRQGVKDPFVWLTLALETTAAAALLLAIAAAHRRTNASR